MLLFMISRAVLVDVMLYFIFRRSGEWCLGCEDAGSIWCTASVLWLRALEVRFAKLIWMRVRLTPLKIIT